MPDDKTNRNLLLVLALSIAGVLAAGIIFTQFGQNMSPSPSQVTASGAKPVAAAAATDPEPPASAPSPVPSRITALVLAGSNTIGSRIAPLVAAFIRQQGGDVGPPQHWTAPQAWREQSDWLFAANPNCRFGADPTVENYLPIIRMPPSGPTAAVIVASGSGCGFPLLSHGFANVSMASRRIKGADIDNDQGSGPWTDTAVDANHPGAGKVGEAPRYEHVIAMDAVVVIANPALHIGAKSRQQIKDIFLGAGRSAGATIISRNNRSGTYDTFKNLVLDGQDLPFALLPPDHIKESNDAIIELVASIRNAIGFVGLDAISGRSSQDTRRREALVVPIAECGLEYRPGPESSSALIKTENYPLSRRLFLYTPGMVRDKSRWAASFVDFVRSPKGQQIVDQSGFVSLSIVPLQSAGSDGELLRKAALAAPIDAAAVQRYVDLTRRARQLSTVIRFGFGRTELDEKAIGDLTAVGQFMNRSENLGRSLVVAGFVDGVGNGSNAPRIALDRARSVAVALARYGAPGAGWTARITPMSFGAEAPVGCNSQQDEEGRRKNRRVELWLL
jgi:phosphate transport system substrate-binding protein